MRLLQMHLLVIALFFLSLPLNAQNEKPDWLLISEGADDEGMTDLTTDNQGNIYAVGFSRDGAVVNGASQTCLSTEGYVYYYAKFDPSGQLQWFRQFTPGNEKTGFNPEKIDVDKNGNVYLFGVCYGNPNVSGTSKTHYLEGGTKNQEFLIKYAPNGDVIWGKVYKNGFYNNERDFVVDDAGNSYLLGYPANVAKIDTHGNEIFRKYLPNGFTPGDICLYKDKIFVATSIYGDREISFKLSDGTQISEPAIAAYEGYFYNTDLLIASLSRENGDLIWADLVRSAIGESSKGIGVDEAGNVTIQGVSAKNAVFGINSKKHLDVYIEGNHDVSFVMQYSENGTLDWIKSLKIKDKSQSNGNYSVSLEVDYNTGDIYSTRAHCNDDLGWAVYYEKFDKKGRILDETIFGFSENYQSNSGFWKSSCGTANFFVHLNNNLQTLYLFGEGSSYSIVPKQFGDNNYTKKTGGGTNFFISKKSLAKADNEDTPQPFPLFGSAPWTGHWRTNWNNDSTIKMFLRESRGQVSGTYEYQNGKIEAKINHLSGQSALKGTWKQDNASGWFEFVLSSDKQEFKGSWGYDNDNSAQGTWNGKKE